MLYLYHSRIFAAVLPGVTDASKVEGIVVPADENTGIACDIKGFAKDGRYIIFLPVRADISSLVLYPTDSEGHRLERIVHDFSKEELIIAAALPVSVMKSDLPCVEVEFVKNGGSLEEVEDSKDHSVYAFGNLTVTCSDETADSLGCDPVVKSRDRNMGQRGSVALRGHGNASWLLDKKSYNLELEAGSDLLSMGSAEKWILLANSVDKTLIRNRVFYRLAEDCGLKYTPEVRQTDLFIDGEYRGCYSLAEAVEAAPGRIDIAPGRDFLYRWGLPGPEAHQLPFMMFRDELTNVVELKSLKDVSSQRKGLDIAFEMMNAIRRTDDESYLDLIDLESWARYYWVQEFSKNTDATSRSVYTIWREDTGRMEMSPVWDMDQTAGVVEPFERPADYLYPTEWAVRHEEWYVPLFEHPSFENEVKRIYSEGGIDLAFDRCAGYVSEAAAEVKNGAVMNFTRWDVMGEPENNQIVRWMGESTLDTQTQWLEIWVAQRRDWIKEEMANETLE